MADGSGKVMKPGQRGQDIALLQQRLEASGDLVGMSVPGEYDGAVVGAVKRFQIGTACHQRVSWTPKRWLRRSTCRQACA